MGVEEEAKKNFNLNFLGEKGEEKRCVLCVCFWNRNRRRGKLGK